MRTIGGSIILVAVLGLLGCRGPNSNAPKGPTPPAPKTSSTPDAALPPDVGGVVYGRVLDNYNQPVPKAVIEVVDLQDPQPAGTRFEVTTYDEGLFDILNLKPEHRYRLVVRVEGSTLYGMAEVTPPTRSVVIHLIKDPDARVPAKSATPELLPEKKTDPKAGVPLLPPTTKENRNQPADLEGPTGKPAQPADAVDKSRVVDVIKGFETVQPKPPPLPANIPNIPVAPPASPAPMPPAQEPIREQLQRVPLPALPNDPSAVPSCTLVGDRLTDFALADLDGKPYRYRTNANGRVVLLFFWNSSDGGCLDYLSVLGELYQTYSPYRFDVVGIAYDPGNGAGAAQGVRVERGRYHLRYPQLLGGGGPGPCPVRSAFGVVDFPTLVLLNRDGTIVYRGGRLPVGDSEQGKAQQLRKLRELEQKIRETLQVTEP